MELVIVGWAKGFKAVSMMRILMARCGMRLKEAKQVVEDLLEGKTIRVTCRAKNEFEIFRKEVEETGAVFE